MNGVLNCSILDGWWPEACKDGINGWAIGDKNIPETVEKQDERDAKALYDTLLERVIPTYYNHHQKWLEMMKESIESTRTFFSVDRMVNDYYKLLYKK
jgi:starch phosphorylase